MRVNFDDFNKKNRNKTVAFENMCRMMFIRYFNKSPLDYEYDFNNAGLEIHPFKNDIDGKWYGLQCKYFEESTSNSSRYLQILKSITKAISYYKKKKNQLDCIFIYTNSNFRLITYDSIKEKVEKKEKLSARERIVELAHANQIELKWVKTDNIIDSLYTKGNYDLCNIYFKDSNEVEFLESDIATDEKTYITSKEYINLSLNNGQSIDILNTFTDTNIKSLVGAAGTGKTQILKKIFIKFSDEFIKHYFSKPNKIINSQIENIVIPIFIKLNLCIDGDLKNTIRKKLQDFKMQTGSEEYKYLYLLDGIDEVSTTNLQIIIEHIKWLANNEKANLIISSRTDSMNYLSLVNSGLDVQTFEIDELKEKQIEAYLQSKQESKKTQKFRQMLLNENKTILNEITDILSLHLIYDNIDEIEQGDTKITLVKLSINNIIQNYAKLNELCILEPKENGIITICKNIAYNMQLKGNSYINTAEVQDIVKITAGVKDNNQINIILDSLCDMFLQKSNNKLYFNHRRYHEYFLFIYLKHEYFNNPSILRTLNLLTNRDFIINIFLTEISNELKKKFDITKCISLGLLEAYLGINYFYNSNYEITSKKIIYQTEELYNGNDSILYLLSLYEETYIKNIIKNKEIGISNFIGQYSNNNLYKFIEIYHRENESKINREIIEILGVNLEEKPRIGYDERFSYMYCEYQLGESSFDELYNKVKLHKEINLDTLYATHNPTHTNEYMYAFYKIALEFELQWVTDNIGQMSIEEMDLMCYCLLEPEHIEVILNNSKQSDLFKNNFVKKYNKYNKLYGIATLVVYSLIKGRIESTEAEVKLKKFWKEKNQTHIWTWNAARNINHNIGILLKKETKNVQNYASLGYSLYKSFYTEYNKQAEMLGAWKNNLINANFRKRKNLIYFNSRELGIYISKIKLSHKLKEFMFDIIKYDDQIYLPNIIWEIYKRNRQSFNSLFNKSYLLAIYNRYQKVEFSYDEKIDFYFKFSTMLFTYDKNLSDKLFMTGLNESFVRPISSGEDFFDTTLVIGLYYAYINMWLDERKIKMYINKLYNMLKIMQYASNEGSEFQYLKWFVKLYFDDKIQFNFGNIEAEEPYMIKQRSDKYINNLSDEIVSEICDGEKYGYDYNTWVKIVRHKNFNIESMLNTFCKVYFPSNYSIRYRNDYCYAIAALLDMDEYKEETLKYINDTRNKYSGLMLIKAFTVLGDSVEGTEVLEFLFKFAGLLIGSSKKELLKVQNEALNFKNNNEILDYIYTTRNEDWVIGEGNTYLLKNNPNIMIVSHDTDFNDRERCVFEWAIGFPDKNAYRIEYKILYKNNLVDSFALAAVDGYRAYLPFPNDDQLVERNKYYLAKIFNYNEDEYRRYLCQAGLKIL